MLRSLLVIAAAIFTLTLFSTLQRVAVSAQAGPAATPSPRPTPNTNQIATDILRRVGTWSTKPPTVAGMWFYGHYGLVAYHAGENGGAAIYSDASGSWKLVCGGGGALDQASAVSECGLSASDAAGLIRVPKHPMPPGLR